MRYLTVITIASAAAMLGACSGANNANVNTNGNANLRNINVSRPEISPQVQPTAAEPSNSMNGNPAIKASPGMANEKVMTPAGTPDKRVPPINREGPELKGTPLKKP